MSDELQIEKQNMCTYITYVHVKTGYGICFCIDHTNYYINKIKDSALLSIHHWTRTGKSNQKSLTLIVIEKMVQIKVI